MKLKPLNDFPLIEDIASLGPKTGVYLVGGCVRDWLMGKRCLDLDFVFPVYPEKVAAGIVAKYGGEFRKFEKFLTIRVLIGGRRIDLACFRKEKYPFPAALPEVRRAPGLKEDLKRRDFTANALALSLKGKDRLEVIDPCGGLEDIKKGLLITLHKNSFRDDPTRIFRAARFCGRFSWKLGKNAAGSLGEAVRKKRVALLSRERVRNELFKILAEKNSFPALKLLEKWGVMESVGPGIKVSRKIDTLREPEMKLALLCGSSARPLELLRSFNLEKKTYKRIFPALAPLVEKKSPVRSPDPGQREVLELLRPAKKGIPCAGLLLGNRELRKIGAENIFWNAILEKTARLQWRGIVASGEEALRRAKKELFRLRGEQ